MTDRDDVDHATAVPGLLVCTRLVLAETVCVEGSKAGSSCLTISHFPFKKLSVESVVCGAKGPSLVESNVG